jgi:hypothetical protein
MKNRYRLVRYGRRGGICYLHDSENGKRESLETKDKARATELLVAKNDAAREPAFNLQKARVYLAASDPDVATRTWGFVMEEIVKDSAYKLIKDKPLLITLPADFLAYLLRLFFAMQ